MNSQLSEQQLMKSDQKLLIIDYLKKMRIEIKKKDQNQKNLT